MINFFMNLEDLFMSGWFHERWGGGFLFLLFWILIYNHSLMFGMIIFIQSTVTWWGLLIKSFFGLNWLFFIWNQVHYLRNRQFGSALIFRLEAPISLSGTRKNDSFGDRTSSRWNGKAIGIIVVCRNVGSLWQEIVIRKLIGERWKGVVWEDIHGPLSRQAVKSLVGGKESLTIFTCRISWSCHWGFLLKK